MSKRRPEPTPIGQVLADAATASTLFYRLSRLDEAATRRREMDPEQKHKLAGIEQLAAEQIKKHDGPVLHAGVRYTVDTDGQIRRSLP
jgi:hypothetical protein